MSTYYNFCFLDLDKVTSPFNDPNYPEGYLIENQESYEDYYDQLICRTMPNIGASKVVSYVLAQDDLASDLKISFGAVFINMFWGNTAFRRKHPEHFKRNAWNLEWIPIQQLNSEYLDYYSIHYRDVQQVLQQYKKLPMKTFFELLRQSKSPEVKATPTIKVIEAWRNLFQMAAKKQKGLVFHVG